MKFLTFLRKFGNYYRKNGFLSLCRHIVTNLFHYDKLVILESEINENRENIKAKIPANIRLLSRTEEDINKLTEFWPPNTYTPHNSTPQMIRNLITERLSAGEECMIAEYNGETIHMNWIGFHNSHVFDSYEKKRGLGPGEAQP